MRIRLFSKPAWPQLRRRIEQSLSEAFPGTTFEIAPDDAVPAVAWLDGPAEGTVAAVVGDVPGWRFESSLLGPDPDAASGTAAVTLRRTFTPRAVAVAVVRFRGSNPRPFDSSRAVCRENLWAILEEDDPARSAYPIVDAVADMLLEDAAAHGLAGDGPHGAAATDTLDVADVLSHRLEAAGYDRLWSAAWRTVRL